MWSSISLYEQAKAQNHNFQSYLEEKFAKMVEMCDCCTPRVQSSIHDILVPVLDVGHGFFTALHYAAASGQLSTLKLLLRLGSNCNSIDALTWTPLFWAAKLGHFGCAMALVDSNADARWKDSVSRNIHS